MNKIFINARYIFLPLLSLIITCFITLTFVFSNLAGVATLFNLQVVALLAVQLVIFILSLGQAYFLSKKLAKYFTADKGLGISREKLLMLGGNILGVAQLLLCIAIWNSFWYNLHKVQFIPLWALLVIILIIGLTAPPFFILLILRSKVVQSK